MNVKVDGVCVLGCFIHGYWSTLSFAIWVFHFMAEIVHIALVAFESTVIVKCFYSFVNLKFCRNSNK